MGIARAGRWPVPMISVVVTALFLAFTAVLVFEGYLLMGQNDWLEPPPRPPPSERKDAELAADDLARLCAFRTIRRCSVAGIKRVAPGRWRSDLIYPGRDASTQTGFEVTRIRVCYVIDLDQFLFVRPGPDWNALHQFQMTGRVDHDLVHQRLPRGVWDTACPSPRDPLSEAHLLWLRDKPASFAVRR
jgi:hypothetical protein